MEEERQGVSEEQTTVMEKPTADSSVEEIMEYAREHLGDEETQSESPAEETQESDTSGEDVKTQDSEDIDQPEESESEEGKAIPYERFKQVNDKMKELETQAERYDADVAEMQEVLKDPEILSVIMKKRGYTDEAISNYMAEKGIQKPVQKDLNLETQEGWQQLIEQKIAEKLNPLNHQLSEIQQEKQRLESQRWAETQRKEAEKLATEVYNLTYGDETKDVNNTETAVGKISSYLRANPEDAKLGHAKLLKLAIATEGFKVAKEQGKKEETERQQKVKSAAMESDAFHTKEETPDKDWPIERVLEYAEKHPDYKLKSEW